MGCWTVFCFTHISSGRRFIGLTSQSLTRRWNSYVSKSRKSKGKRKDFANIIREHGSSAFSRETLEVCTSQTDGAIALEQWIKFHDTRNPERGFNLEKTEKRNSEKRWTIYCHTHIATGRRYIGLTVKTMEQRWHQHASQAKYSIGGHYHFANAIRKYGKDAFSHEVLEVHTDLDEANLAEEWFIRLFRTRDLRYGFNLVKGGKHTSHSVRNPWDRPEFREKTLRNLAKANSISSEERSMRAKKLWQDDGFRQKITEASRQAYSNPELVERVTQAMKESFATLESKAKRSASSKAMWESEEFRARNAELWEDSEFRERCESGLKHGASINSNKTHCPKGHEYSPENTFVNSKGSRECRICSRRQKNESARRMRERKLETVSWND